MFDLIGNPEDRFSHNEAQMMIMMMVQFMSIGLKTPLDLTHKAQHSLQSHHSKSLSAVCSENCHGTSV